MSCHVICHEAHETKEAHETHAAHTVHAAHAAHETHTKSLPAKKTGKKKQESMAQNHSKQLVNPVLQGL